MVDRQRARGCLLGLAAGDALGRPAENLAPEEIAGRWGRLTELARGPDGMAVGTDDTEYALFTAFLLETYGSALSSGDVAREWRRNIIAPLDERPGPMRGAGFSELGTVQALRRGLEPPLSGRWQQHGWSDGLAMRAAPYGVFAAGEPAEAARLAGVDGAVSHGGEGVHGGRAVAAAVALAMTGAPPAQVIDAALAVIPADSWTGRTVRASVRIAGARRSAIPVIADERHTADLHEAVVVRHCPWADLAPEAVALAFAAYLLGAGEVEVSVTNAVNLGRDADTTAAIAGALAGAGQGEDGVPERWSARIGPARGTCLRAVAGRDVRDAADALAAAARREHTGPGRAPGARREQPRDQGGWRACRRGI
ncbi:ADP-ribosylglycohydrolase family protein [Actinomadura alba]|uniref:ADP-ribosylglycohydrolase family protein n=1 Tax=Actinomadura alba TaxID=406431 RepID=UPI0028A826B5|nr:ADP-ribosylglycohydrolase family protein [Actinomadura alba]